MRKIKGILALVLLGSIAVNANPVLLNTAQKVAANFYQQTYHSTAQTLTLVYTERSSDGEAVFFVFDVNDNNGFVIVSAEDAGHPVIGSSSTGQYVIPPANSNAGFWMDKNRREIISMRANNMQATSDVTDEWNTYINNTTKVAHQSEPGAVTPVSPLCSTTWDQSTFYNAMCPDGSVTGCVATAMAQIMKYWNYPSVGLGSNCYKEEVASGYFENYGELCATFDTSYYNWSAMPDKVTSENSQVAKLMYDCGVSVNMDYSPSASGAACIGKAPSAENAYVEYFNYNSSTIKGELQSHYSESDWIALIENELTNGRLVQYQGTDTVYGGHSWVCDGFNSSNQLHMNWGWSGQDDGYYLATLLTPTGSGYDFSEAGVGAIIGIEPPGDALAVPQISNNQTIKVYPNPSNGMFNVEVSELTGNPQISIYNMLGQEIYSSKLISLQTTINIGNQPKGIYLYRVMTETGGQISTGKLVVE